MRILSVCMLMMAVAACSEAEDPPMQSGGVMQPVAGSGGGALASAMIAPKSGNTMLAGTATFSGAPGAISVTVSVTGAPPGDHGVHLHETGDCSAPDAMSAGGHWNPAMHMHGKPGPTSHIGDLGNITVGADGKGTLTLTNSEWAIGGAADKNPVGKAIVVHAMPDDYTTQMPPGNAGARIGCGVVM